MKASEAPEKIILSADRDTKTIYDNWVVNDYTDSIKIEYTRTDAFIDKAVQYLKDHKEEIETEDGGIAGWIPDYFIEDFRKYMKGE